MSPYRIGLVVALGLLGVFALPASPASAHAALVRTSPVQGSVVQQAPFEIVVTSPSRSAR
jgi:methionine-rich copper-binding protein CopC